MFTNIIPAWTLVEVWFFLYKMSGLGLFVYSFALILQRCQSIFGMTFLTMHPTKNVHHIGINELQCVFSSYFDIFQLRVGVVLYFLQPDGL